MSFAQFYVIARTAHVERAIESSTHLFYLKTNYDFDAALAGSSDFIHKVKTLTLARHLLRHKVDRLEVNEPLMLPAWKSLLPCIVTLFLLAPKLRLVTYAIENKDPSDRLSQVTRLPLGLARKIVRVIASFLVKRMTLIVFGTSGSAQLYRSLVGPRNLTSRTEVITALPRPEQLAAHSARQPHSFVFLGDLSERKGFDLLYEAWGPFAEENPTASLCILGKGVMAARARELADRDGRVDFYEDPPRDKIREILLRSENAILPSVTTSTWREQVGLPIVEAWAHGVRVLTSDATGIQENLRAASHIIFPEPLSSASVRSMLQLAIDSHPKPSDLLRSLPTVDGRYAAQLRLEGAR